MLRATLLEYASFYVRLMDSSDGYSDQFRFTISRFEQWLGRSLFIDELTEPIVNDYLAATRETLSPETRRNRRNMLVRLWRHAASNPALEVRPPSPNRDAIGKVRKVQRAPQAWSVDDVRKLLDFADKLRGKYAEKIDKRLYWRAYILSAWSSGLRRCDLMSIRRCDIPASGRVVIVQIKTGRHTIGNFSAEALAAIDALCAQHRSDVVFPLWCLLRCWRKIAKRIVRKAGIGGAIGRIRASSGTAVENSYPGQGPQFLGNSPQVFYKHYFDRRLQTDIPQPPPLGRQ